MRAPLVYITNQGGHDYTLAQEFGSLVFLTRGKINRYKTSTIYRDMIQGMQDSEKHDFLLVSSLSILNSIASGILARKHGQVNYLLFCDGRYLERSIDFDALID